MISHMVSLQIGPIVRTSSQMFCPYIIRGKQLDNARTKISSSQKQIKVKWPSINKQ
jgi:hypothetical protein